jgi:hypothetical protein
MYHSSTVDRHLVNRAQSNYELAGKCIDIVIKHNMYVNSCVDPYVPNPDTDAYTG